MSISQRIIIENVWEAVRFKAYISHFHKITKVFSLPHTPLISATIEEGFFQLIPKKSHFFAEKNGFKSKIATFEKMFRNMPLGAKKMLSGAGKVQKHIETIPKPKGLHLNIVKIILNNFLEKSKFAFFSKFQFLKMMIFQCIFSRK